MSYAEEVDGSTGRSPARIIIAVILVIIGILAIVAAILYFTEPAKSLPSVLGQITSPVHRAESKRSLRGAVALVIGLILLAGGVFAFVWKPKDS